MTKVKALILALVLLFTVGASTTLAYLPSNLTTSERYLAYRVKLERGDSWYMMNSSVEAVARTRAYQISYVYRHDLTAYWRLRMSGCWVGEILAWTYIDYYRTAISWAIRAWNNSPTHEVLLQNRNHFWTRYGVGTRYRNGKWYFVVSFTHCG